MAHFANLRPSLPPGGTIPFFLSVLELALSLIDTGFALGFLSGLFWYGEGGIISNGSASFSCQLDILGKRKPHRRNCFRRDGSWACLWGHFPPVAN